MMRPVPALRLIAGPDGRLGSKCYHENPARIRWAGNLDRKTHPREKDSHKLEKAWNDGELIDGLQHEKVDKLSLP
jgi:hypothetical protein